jgi:hypothetical protein
MNRVEVDETDLSAKDLAKLARTGTVVLTRKGKALAAVNALNGSDWESVALANNPKFQAIIEESRRSYREEGGVSLDQVCAELGLKSPKRRRPKRKRMAKRA